MIITKMALPRRTFLRGLGATVALPLLDAPPFRGGVHTDGDESGAMDTYTRRSAYRLV